MNRTLNIFSCYFLLYRANNEKLEKERDLNRQEKVRTARLIKQYKLEKGHVLEVRNSASRFSPSNQMMLQYGIMCQFTS